MLCYKLHFLTFNVPASRTIKSRRGETRIAPTYKAAHKALKLQRLSWGQKGLQRTQLNIDIDYFSVNEVF